jgi:hypothetical protein
MEVERTVGLTQFLRGQPLPVACLANSNCSTRSHSSPTSRLRSQRPLQIMHLVSTDNPTFQKKFIRTAVVMKSYTFWDISPCSPLKVSRRFGETRGLQLQHEACNKQSAARCRVSRSFLPWLTLQPQRWRQYVPPKHRMTFNTLHGVISQKIELFIAIAM